MLSPANERKLTFLKHLSFVPRIYGTNSYSAGRSESGYTGFNIPHAMSKVPEIVKISNLDESPYVHPKAIDPAEPTSGTCSELRNVPFCTKITHVALFSFSA